MRYSIAIILCSFFNFAQSNAQAVKVIDSDALKALTYKMNDTTYVLNFWATWCSPCVKEIGYFEELHRLSKSAYVKVIPFLKEKEITADVLLMTDLDYNSWIDQIDPGWTGAVPATLIYNKDTRLFLEQELTRDELFNHVTQIQN